ncbi:hypothetical protein EYF80_014207 [Liparis tanakae]|uniref:Uncharacterized protein n=1 Tax=Liparis tanakae TaxID=230148 RepID=A0A4Z2ICW5_9TELE|nr:hypothetical protein EYF80_014207 [Liparis tanakae]
MSTFPWCLQNSGADEYNFEDSSFCLGELLSGQQYALVESGSSKIVSSGLLCAQCPMGYGPAYYTWGLLPEPAEACMRRGAPLDWADVALILSTTL